MSMFGSGSAGGGGLFGASGAPAMSAAPKKAHHAHWWEKAIDGAGGILAGVATTGYHLVADPIGEVVTGGSYNSKIDDIGKAIVDDYKHRYSSWDNFKSDPLAGVLDVLTLASAAFTLGGSLAVRGAATGAAVARGAEVGRAAKFAGLVHSEELSNLAKSAGVGSDEFLSARASAEGKAAASLGRKGPIDRMLSGESGRTVLTKDGNVLVPREGKLIGINGQVLDTVPLASSPLKRMMTEAGLKVSNTERLRGASVIGSQVRHDKIAKRIDRILGENETGNVYGAGKGLANKRAIAKAEKNPHEAAWLETARVTGHATSENAGKMSDFYGGTANQLERRAADGSGKQFGEFDKAARDLLDTVDKEHALDGARTVQRGPLHGTYVAKVAQERAREAAIKGRSIATRKVALTKQLAELDRHIASGGDKVLNGADSARLTTPFSVRPTTRVSQEAGPLSGAADNVVTKRVPVPRENTLLRRRKTLVDQIDKASADIEKSRAEVRAHARVERVLRAGGVAKLRSTVHGIANEQKALHGDLTETIRQLRDRQELFNNASISEVFQNPGKHLLRINEAEQSAAKYTTDFIKGDLNKNVRSEMADGSAMFRMVMNREPTEEELAALIPRTHTRAALKPKSVNQIQKKYAPKANPAPGKGSRAEADFSKFSSGYNFQMAADSLSPAGVFKTYNQARAYRAKTRLLGRIAQSGIKIESPEHKAELYAHGGFEFVGGNHPLLEKIAGIKDKLDNEVRLVVGESGTRAEASQYLEGLLAKYTTEAGEHAVPKVTYKMLSDEMRRSENFIGRMIDAPTAVFRAAVLNLRPAWMVNNFVGQMMLLLYGQGIYHGAREYMGELSRVAKSGDLSIFGRTIREGGHDPVATLMRDKAGALNGRGGAGAEFKEAGRQAERSVIGAVFRDPAERAAESVALHGADASIAAHIVRLKNLVFAPARGVKHLTDFMGHVNTVLTDDIPRRAAFMGSVRPMLHQVMKARPGISTEEALGLVMKDDVMVAKLIDRTMGDLIDFSRMNGTERDVIRRMLPFYSWMKHITLRTGRMVRDDPHQALVSYQLGRQYVDGAKQRFGVDVPGNLKGALVVGHHKDGSPRVVPVNGMNNFQTPADIAAMVGNLLGKGEMKFGGSNVLSQMNPVLKAPAEVFTGRDFFFGGPLYSDPASGKGLLGLNLGSADKPWTPQDESRSKAAAIGSRYLSSLGPLALYARYKKAGPITSGDNRLLERSHADALSAYLGYGVSTLNQAKAEQMAHGGVQYALVGYDPTMGEHPGVFGRQQPTKQAPIF